MPKKNKLIVKEKKIGTTVISKRSFWSYRKNRSRVYTLIFLLILLYFFIVNNSNPTLTQGPYPPGYIKTQQNISSSK